MKRRDFIKVGSIITIPVLFNGFGLRAFANKPVPSINDYNDKVLVLIQLDGGNDTLNTIIPLDQYTNLSKVRANILIPENKVIKYTNEIGFHPSLVGMKQIMDNGQLNVIRAVGYPNQNRSHFRSTDIWMSGSSTNEYKANGWMGSYFHIDHSDYPTGYPNEEVDYPFAITIGATASATCQGTIGNYSVAVSDATQAGELFDGEWDNVPNNCYGDQLSFVRETVRQSNAYSDIISKAYEKGNNLSTKYPDDSKLAASLKDVAKMISGGLKTKVYIVRLGGFDTHSAQVDPSDPTKGKHAELLNTLSVAVSAFQDDLNLLELDERVVGMTFSEFGRRIKSNASFGTDHGSAVDLFVFGSCINSGMLGNNPEISDNVGKGEAVAMQYDFRSVYGSILVDWFEADEDEVKSILFDDFQKLPIINSCSPTANDKVDIENDFNVEIFPNPTSQNINISFVSQNENVKLELYSELGTRLKVLVNRKISEGNNTLKIDTSSLNSGIYFIRVITESKITTKRFVKI